MFQMLRAAAEADAVECYTRMLQKEVAERCLAL